jgi:hypothetical protein
VCDHGRSVAVTLVNFATRPFRESQRRNAETGVAVGGVDRVEAFGPRDLDPRFRRTNRAILGNQRGAGLWLWKPYLVERTLRTLRPGDWLFYSDSGAYFVDSVAHLVEFASDRALDVLAFEQAFLERRYTKRDAFVLLDCDRPEFSETRQRGGGFSLWRSSPAALALAESWLAAAQDLRLISDRENELGLPNYPDWIAHRHDQSIFSLLTKKAGIPAFRDPSQDGEKWRADYPDSTYPQVMQLTRARAIAVRTRLRGTIVRRAGDLRGGRVRAALRHARSAPLPDERS